MKQTAIINLREGDFFEIVGLETLYRNLQVKHLNDSGVSITGDIADKHGDSISWRTLLRGYVISGQTPVKFIKAGTIKKKLQHETE